MTKFQIVAATGCPTGIAHTYMAQEALEQAAKKRGISIKVETHGQIGIENALTAEEIEAADAVIIAADKDVQAERFAGKKIIDVPVASGIRNADQLIADALEGAGKIKQPKQSVPTNKEEVAVSGIGHTIYKNLMNGVSHMLPFVVSGGVLIAISFLWGIYSADPTNAQYNEFAARLNGIGGFAMSMMVPILSAFIAESIAKRPGLVVGFVGGLIAADGGTGFLGGIVSGFLAGYVVLGLMKALVLLPKSLDGLKAIFLYPVLGVLITGLIMDFVSGPMATINEAMMSFLAGFENSSPFVLGIIVGCMCAFDMGGPINKAAYVTGTALLAQGNTSFMAGVSAACIAPPLITGFAVLFFGKYFDANEKNAGLVNFILGSTHITEGAIPFCGERPAESVTDHDAWFFDCCCTDLSLQSASACTSWWLSGITRCYSWSFMGKCDFGRINRRWFVARIGSKKKSCQTENGRESMITEEYIFVDSLLKNKAEALSFLAKESRRQDDATDASEVEAAFILREEQGSTGMMDGFAIPHAKSSVIRRPFISVIKLREAIDWDSLDGQKIHTIIAMFIPENEAGSTHLTILSQVARMLMKEDFKKSDPSNYF